jgi:hypothetical protein
MNHLTDTEILASIQRTTHPTVQRIVWMGENRDLILLPVVESAMFVAGAVPPPLAGYTSRDVCHLDHIIHHYHQNHQNGVMTCRYGVVNDTVYLSLIAEDVEPTQ